MFEDSLGYVYFGWLLRRCYAVWVTLYSALVTYVTCACHSNNSKWCI